jgi:hypothetical protein
LTIANFISLFCVFDFFQFSEVELPFPCPILVLCKIYLTLFPDHVELKSGDFAAILFPLQRCWTNLSVSFRSWIDKKFSYIVM